MGIHLIYGLRVIHMTKTKGTKAVKPIYLLKAIPPVLFIKLQWRVSLDPKELYKLENGDLPVALAVGLRAGGLCLCNLARNTLSSGEPAIAASN